MKRAALQGGSCKFWVVIPARITGLVGKDQGLVDLKVK